MTKLCIACGEERCNCLQPFPQLAVVECTTFSAADRADIDRTLSLANRVRLLTTGEDASTSVAVLVASLKSVAREHQFAEEDIVDMIRQSPGRLRRKGTAS